MWNPACVYWVTRGCVTDGGEAENIHCERKKLNRPLFLAQHLLVNRR